MIIAGPCLLNNNQSEIENTIETARQLYAIDPEIRFRCKLWGGGTMPDRYKPGIGHAELFKWIGAEMPRLECGTEVQTIEQAAECQDLVNFMWIGARNSQNYGLLSEFKPFCKGIFIKRGPGMTIDEMIGIHDICRDIHSYTPTMIERGINTFCRTPEDRYTADFDGMIRVMHERPDINLMFDPSHCCGRKEYIFPLVKAACAIGVKNFMLEVYANPTLTQTDKAQALSVAEFKIIYDYIKKQESK
jgi:3-deoxy-D-arabino-heptulosonate 7-phosphate (DAHP) synthase